MQLQFLQRSIAQHSAAQHSADCSCLQETREWTRIIQFIQEMAWIVWCFGTNLEHLSECSRSSVPNVVGTQVEGVYPGIACTRRAAALMMHILKLVRACVLIGLNQSSDACVQPAVKDSFVG